MTQSILEQLAAAGAATIPQRKLMALESLSINSLVALYRAGEIDSIVLNNRTRRVIIASYLAYVQRRLRGDARDESAQLQTIKDYQRSLSSQGALNAARARRGITSASRKRPPSPVRQAAAGMAEQAAEKAIAKARPKRAKPSYGKPSATAKDTVTTA
jgi:hypothetical protein